MGGPLIERRRVAPGVELSRIGFGSAPLGDITRVPETADAHKVLQAAWDSGIRYFDTAPMYGNGLSERRVGDFLRDKPRDDYVLSTKVGRMLVPDRQSAMERYGTARALPFRCVFDYSYDGILRSHELSLQRLGLERIDIILLHDVGRFSQGDRYDATTRQALEGGLKAMLKLREEGVVRAIGVGVNEWQVLDMLMDHARWDVFLLANRYTLLDNDAAEKFLPRCVKEGVSIIDGAPLHNGLLATGAVPGARYDYAPASEAVLDRVRRIEAVCKRHDVPLIRAALNFPLGHAAVAAIIPGPVNLSEFDSNMKHLHAAIPPALWDDLKREGLMSEAATGPTTPVLG